MLQQLQQQMRNTDTQLHSLHFIIASPSPGSTSSTILIFYAEILSPSHPRCYGYEKQFPVRQFPWRPAEGHHGGVSQQGAEMQYSDGVISLVEYTAHLKTLQDHIMFSFTLCHNIKMKKK